MAKIKNARPAESAGGITALALLVCKVAGVDDAEALTAVGVAAGVLPAIVTYLVDHGGLRGIVGSVWGGGHSDV